VRSLGTFFAIFFFVVFLNIFAFVAQIPSVRASFARRFRRLVGSVVVPAGPTNGTGHGFGKLTHLAVVGVVFSVPTCFADGNGQYIVVLAVGASFTRGVGSAVGFIAVPAASTIDSGNVFHGLTNLLGVDGIDVFAGAAHFAILLSQLIVVLADAASRATCNVIIISRSMLSNWASFTSGCFRK
jgi:hypothetical protein